MAKKDSLPQPNPLSPNPLREEDLLLPQDEFWENHKSKIVAGAIAFVLIALGGIGFRAWQSQAQSEASAALATATTPEEWRAVWQAHPRTPAGANSALLLASALREQGQVEASSAVYEELLAQRGGHYALLPEAALGLAQNQLLLTSPENRPAVVEAFREVALRYPGEAAAAVALLTEAEILLEDQQEEDAVRVFRNLLSDYPGSIPAQVASAQLQRLAPAVLPEESSTEPTEPTDLSETSEDATPPATEQAPEPEPAALDDATEAPVEEAPAE